MRRQRSARCAPSSGRSIRRWRCARRASTRARRSEICEARWELGVGSWELWRCERRAKPARAWYPDLVRALGIDYGERRIGLALSDATGLLASPWKKLANDANVAAAARRLAEEVRALQRDEDGLAAIVVGLPRRLSGEANDQTARVRMLAELLAKE